MKSRVKIPSLMTVLLVGSIASATELRVICPSEIPASSIHLTDLPRSWAAHVAASMYLSSAGATAGPPERKAVLMGDTTWKRGATSWSTTYDLGGSGFPEGKWMECRYGEHNQMILATRLDDATTSCKVHISGGEKAGQKSIQILCHRP
jgi:hypothetical protein